MTWFIDLGRFPVVAVVEKFIGGRVPTPHPWNRTPFTDEQKAQFPKGVELRPAVGDRTIQHIALNRGGAEYLILSKPALDALHHLQTEGWEAIPLEAKMVKTHSNLLAGRAYYLLNLCTHRDLVDLARSNLVPNIRGAGTHWENTAYAPDSSHRKIAIKKELIWDVVLWLGVNRDGVNRVCNYVYFVADPLKEAWCALGMNPAVFEPCIDI